MSNYVIGQSAVASDPARFAYLFDPNLPVRPPNDEEAAKYAARATDPKWHDLYRPAAAELLASWTHDSRSLPVVGALESLPGPAAGEPPADAADEKDQADPAAEPAAAADESPDPLPADPAEAAADRAQADSEVSLRRWGVTETIPATAAEDAG